MAPKTNYASNAGTSLAYQVVGEGPVDLVLVPPWLSNLEHYWEEPSCQRWLERLSSFSRLILFDKRGAGLSDPLTETTSTDDLIGDIEAVMDAAGSDTAALFGALWGGPLGVLFASTRPHRTSALVLYGTFATRVQHPDYPWAPTQEERKKNLEAFAAGWSEGQDIFAIAPSVAGDERFKRWWARMHRLGASPGALTSDVKIMADIDVRSVLPTITAPTLVLHRSGDRLIDPANGRYLAEQIPQARFVELPGHDHLPFVGDFDAMLDEIEEFLTGSVGTHEPDRILATVMFTDIAESTELASKLGDRRWRDLLETHNTIVRKQLARYAGNEVKTIGDGFMVTFGAPGKAIRCARAISAEVRGLGVELKAGLHTGECEVIGDDLGGMTVHIASRVVENASPGEVLVSRTLKELVAGSNIGFNERGTHALKGVPGEWELFAVGDDER